MEKKFGFSLAEALITLLIVCIIAIVSAPIVTKKSRKIDNNTVWAINPDNYATITPTNGRDIKLGKTRSGKSQGIVVVDRLEFKNKEGKVIGWINEDGSTSFSGVSSEMLHEELTSLIADLSRDMQNLLITSKQSNERIATAKLHPISNASQQHEINSARQKHQINNAKQKHPILNYQNSSNETITNEQMQEVEKLTSELLKLIESNNR